MEEKTTIQISKGTLEKLKERKLSLMKSERATYDETLNELIKLSGAKTLYEIKKPVKVEGKK